MATPLCLLVETSCSNGAHPPGGKSSPPIHALVRSTNRIHRPLWLPRLASPENFPQLPLNFFPVRRKALGGAVGLEQTTESERTSLITEGKHMKSNTKTFRALN